MRNGFLPLLGTMAILTGSIHAAEPTTAETARAALYQREVGAALTRHRWAVTEDAAGQLTAERHLIPHVGTTLRVIGNSDSYAHLTINFCADSRTHTAADAKASLYIYQSRSIGSQVDTLLYPPLALRDPELTREYLDILAEADAHLAGKRSITATSGSTRLAAK